MDGVGIRMKALGVKRGRWVVYHAGRGVKNGLHGCAILSHLCPAPLPRRSAAMFTAPTAPPSAAPPSSAPAALDRSAAVDRVDWLAVARTVLTSRAIDATEERELAPSGLVKYQFSARGHELAQALLGLWLDHPHDAATVYYRSRPFMLTAGLEPEEAMAATMARAGSPTGGRDIGVVFSLPSRGRQTVLPMSGDVGAQYTPAVGWAHGIRYRSEILGETEWGGAIAVVLGGDGSCATPGFWAALNMAATGRLPLLMLIEDNGYAISVPSTFQTPGANIASNLASYEGVLILDGDGTDPALAAGLIDRAVAHVRSGTGPCLLRLAVPRLCGHSIQDNQSYKDDATRQAEEARDPLPRLKAFLVPSRLDESSWDDLVSQVETDVAAARLRAEAQPDGDPATAATRVFSSVGGIRRAGEASSGRLSASAETDGDIVQVVGGTRPEGVGLTADWEAAPQPPEPVRINMVDAIRLALEAELAVQPRLVVFGEDVGVKGGVHGLTRDMQLKFGPARVFDTALTEEGIIGRAVGLAYAGLVPVPEIQFRKYADPATEQLNDCGTVRWRTNGRFAAPVIVRMPVGFSPATGDPWHSISGESVFAHSFGWRVVMPSNAEDAVGLLRTALRGDDPVYFLEHRALYFGAQARRPYPGDSYAIPFGVANRVRAGDDLTVVTWGAMVHRCLEAAEALDREAAEAGGDRHGVPSASVDILDLRTIVPWDRGAVLESVRRTGRCLIVHEDNLTAGFGGEIAAVVAQEAFDVLDAPVVRVGAPDCPVPYSLALMEGVVPTVGEIAGRMRALLGF